jgi:hypothetical protein
MRTLKKTSLSALAAGLIAVGAAPASAQIPDPSADPMTNGAGNMGAASPPEPPAPAEAPPRAEPTDEASSGEIKGDAKAALVQSMMGSSGSSHTESRSSSSSSSVTFSQPDHREPASFPPPGSPNPAFNVGAFVGIWTLDFAGVSCPIEMRSSKFMGGLYSTYPSSQCAGGVAGITYWQPTSNGVRLTDQMGRTLAQFFSYGPHRWKGKIGGDKAVLTR